MVRPDLCDQTGLTPVAQGDSTVHRKWGVFDLRMAPAMFS